MRALLEEAGALFGETRGAGVPRHFGDPESEYHAAVESVAVRDRTHRVRLRIGGRAPARMLHGIATSRIPGPERPAGTGVRAGEAAPSAVLTPKGRMVSDLRILRLDGVAEEVDARLAGSGPAAGPEPGSMTRGPASLPTGEEAGEELLLDVPFAGAPGVREHFGRFLPPRFASVDDVSGATGSLTVVGPGAAEALALHVLGLRVDADVLEGLEEEEYRAVELGGGDFVRVVRSGEVATPAFDVYADRGSIRGAWRALLGGGVRPIGAGVWETLRVEAGRPAYGAELDETTIPVEAGLDERLIDHGKGCYTGQEVIVRIRDRGHVNRHLRGLRIAEGAPTPAAGTEVYAPEVRGERSAGELTTVAESPRMGTVALGYVRREVDPGESVRIGAPDGPPAEVVALEGGGWSAP